MNWFAEMLYIWSMCKIDRSIEYGSFNHICLAMMWRSYFNGSVMPFENNHEMACLTFFTKGTIWVFFHLAIYWGMIYRIDDRIGNVYSIRYIRPLNKRQRKPKRKSRMDNPDTQATLGTRTETN